MKSFFRKMSVILAAGIMTTGVALPAGAAQTSISDDPSGADHCVEVDQVSSSQIDFHNTCQASINLTVIASGWTYLIPNLQPGHRMPTDAGSTGIQGYSATFVNANHCVITKKIGEREYLLQNTCEAPISLMLTVVSTEPRRIFTEYIPKIEARGQVSVFIDDSIITDHTVSNHSASFI